ncbi:MAG: arginase family protein [Bacillota bacterium]
MKIQVIALPYNVQGKGSGGASGPGVLIRGDLLDRIARQGHELAEPRTVQMSAAEEAEYGGWNRVGLAGGHLAGMVKEARLSGAFVLGLLADCNGVLGVLGGLQSAGGTAKPRVGLVYIDAHGDYNTPETSPSGMLGGMPVAVAAGKCLHRLRIRNMLENPLKPHQIVLAGMRDLDDLEREAVETDRIKIIREDDLISRSDKMHEAMRSLSETEDLIYVHVDLDILDPTVAPAAGLPSPGGLTGEQLGLALKAMLQYPKVVSLALVSYRADTDIDGRTGNEVETAILLATEGLLGRSLALI